ncbi:MAG: hypothetical protein E7299_07260 [Lachnospiraceae bacterium]|nr:hypothetical protein [Lachnospiraceae bacterium]
MFCDVELAGAIATVVLNSFSVVVLAYFMHKTLQKYYDKLQCKDWMGVITCIATLSLFFVAMLFPLDGSIIEGMEYRYVGVFTPNPFHNATYIATRPFSIVTFFLFARILDYYEERSDWKEFATFGLFLLLSTMTKPSFTLVFVSTAGILMVFRMITKKWKNFWPSVKLGVTFIPTFVALLYQFGGVFGGSLKAGADGGIGIGLASVWKLYTDNIPLAIVLACAFPLLVLIFHLKELKTNTLYCFSWFQYFISLAELIFLYEKGYRFDHMNFSWGYMHGIFFVFVVSLIIVIRDTISVVIKRERRAVLLMAFWLLYAWHFSCGVHYFIDIWKGFDYY